VQRKMVLLLAACSLIFALNTQVGLSMDEEESQLDPDVVLQKLNIILANQELILEQFEEVQKELVIIKIRSSR